MRARLERSVLSMPATDWRKIEKGLQTDADVALIDLEDSVAPSEKKAARGNVIRALNELDWGEKPRTYRVNAVETTYFYDDLIEVTEAAAANLDLIVIPKVQRPQDVQRADEILTQVERYQGLEVGKIGLEALIESAEGLVNVETIATASPRLEALIFGPGDFAASVRMPAASIGGMDEWDRLYPGHRFHYPMMRMMVAARAAGLRPIDGPVADFRDADALEGSSLLARSLGFEGKWCIHPNQIEVVNRAFSPSDEEVERSQRIVDAYEEALADGTGVVSVDGVMVDEASVKMAQTILRGRTSRTEMR